MRRNRLMLAAASTVFIALISALAISLSATVRSRAAERGTRELLGDVRTQNVILSRMITVADPRQLGPDAKVTDMLAEGVEFALSDFGDHPRVLSQVLSSIGTNYREIGMWSEAIRFLSLAIEYQQQVPVRNREKEAFLNNGLGLVYSRMSDLSNAELYYRRAVELEGAVKDPIDPGQQAVWEFNLGTLLWKMDRNEEAEAILLKSLKAYDDPAHPHVNATVFSLGRALERHTDRKQEGLALLGALVKIHLRSGDLVQAEELIAEELFIIGDTIQESGSAATAYVHKARLLVAQGHPDQARPLLEHAERIYLGSINPEHPTLRAVKKLLASLPDWAHPELVQELST